MHLKYMERKQKWIESSLHSIDNMQRAEASSYLYDMLIAQSRLGAKLVPISSKTVWQAAAAITLLIALNVFSLSHVNTKDKPKQDNVFAQEYFSYVNEVQL